MPKVTRVELWIDPERVFNAASARHRIKDWARDMHEKGLVVDEEAARVAFMAIYVGERGIVYQDDPDVGDLTFAEGVADVD